MAVCMTALSCKTNNADIIGTGDKIPRFTLVSEIYDTVSSENLKGKVTFLCFFATWCPPCQKELADIQNKLLPEFGDVENFKLLVVGREHTDAELRRYNEKKQFTFLLYPDPEREVYSLFAKQSIPRAYVIGRDCRVVETHLGYGEEEFDAMMQTIRDLLNNQRKNTLD